MATKASAWYDYISTFGGQAFVLSVNVGLYIIQAWADWRCLSFERRQCESLRGGISKSRFPMPFSYLPVSSDFLSFGGVGDSVASIFIMIHFGRLIDKILVISRHVVRWLCGGNASRGVNKEVCIYIPVDKLLDDEDAEIQYVRFFKHSAISWWQNARTAIYTLSDTYNPIDVRIEAYSRQGVCVEGRFQLDKRTETLRYDLYRYGDANYIFISKDKKERIDFYEISGEWCRYKRVCRDELVALLASLRR